MVSQKLESVLNLGLSMSEEQRGLSGEINSAFQAQTGTWELIVKYNGDLMQYERSGIVIEPHTGGSDSGVCRYTGGGICGDAETIILFGFTGKGGILLCREGCQTESDRGGGASRSD